MESVPLSSLPHKKALQLSLAISIPAIYISIEDYEYDPAIDAVVYNIEVGALQEQSVFLHKVGLRYSALQQFDLQIRKRFGDSRYLLPFPPKKLLNNRDPAFLKDRASQLQMYLGNLVRIAGVCNTDVFYRFFGDINAMHA